MTAIPSVGGADRPPEIPATQEHRFPCDACGGDMRFDPGDDRLICDHCGNAQGLDRPRPVLGTRQHEGPYPGLQIPHPGQAFASHEPQLSEQNRWRGVPRQPARVLETGARPGHHNLRILLE